MNHAATKVPLVLAAAKLAANLYLQKRPAASRPQVSPLKMLVVANTRGRFVDMKSDFAAAELPHFSQLQ